MQADQMKTTKSKANHWVVTAKLPARFYSQESRGSDFGSISEAYPIQEEADCNGQPKREWTRSTVVDVYPSG
ncbi:MAG: hypothetical protein ACK57P_15510 [Planctomycetota bacterium]